MDIDNLVNQSKQYKKKHNLTGGVIVFFDGELQGWVNKLRDPHHWRPGSIAVDDSGQCFKAVGGDDQNGAYEWTKRFMILIDEQYIKPGLQNVSLNKADESIELTLLFDGYRYRMKKLNRNASQVEIAKELILFGHEILNGLIDEENAIKEVK